MTIRSFNMKKVHFKPQKEGEGLLGCEVSYLSEIGAQIYLSKYRHFDIYFFSIN